MQWKTKTPAEKRKEKAKWKLWFAWYPVKCVKRDGSYDRTVWLERIYRRNVYHEWYNDDLVRIDYSYLIVEVGED